LWIIVPIIFGLVATLLTKMLNLTGLGIINRLLGGVLSMAKFVILLSCVLNVMVSLNILNNERTEGSVLLEPVQSISKFAIEHVSEKAPELMEKAGELIPEK
jgi:membrane protein required for colicin V production